MIDYGFTLCTFTSSLWACTSDPKTGMGLSVLHLTAMSSFDMDCEGASLETSLNDSPNHKSKL